MSFARIGDHLPLYRTLVDRNPRQTMTDFLGIFDRYVDPTMLTFEDNLDMPPAVRQARIQPYTIWLWLDAQNA